jgi:hypothetical protein
VQELIAPVAKLLLEEATGQYVRHCFSPHQSARRENLSSVDVRGTIFSASAPNFEATSLISSSVMLSKTRLTASSASWTKPERFLDSVLLKNINQLVQDSFRKVKGNVQNLREQHITDIS